MLIINDEQIKNLIPRLKDPEQRQSCLGELQKMVEIKGVLLWRADTAQACCGWSTVVRFTNEVQFLEAALDSFQEGHPDKTASILEEYRIYLSTQL